MRILVTGGAGYLGSHTTIKLIDAGHTVVIVDDFSRSKRAVLGRIERIVGQPVPLHEVDLTDQDATLAMFEDVRPDAVLHFAGLKAVGESVEQPLDYYSANLGCALSVLHAMKKTGVRQMVFSSSATVYGANAQLPMTEDLPTSATNPYGWTKVMIEQMLRDASVADPSVRFAILRYFNPAGAHASGTIGEDPHGIPNNLMPLLSQVAVGRRSELLVYGDDYPTPDGTGRRDYIHVEDLAEGHVAALRAIGVAAVPLSVWNLGTGRSTSVLEMVAAFSRACGHPLPIRVVDRRPGDVADSYADPSKAEVELGWRARRSVDHMCADAWRWQQQNPTGLPDDH